MVDLTNGYPEGVDYLKHVFNQLSPANIRFCLNLSGFSGPAVESEFSYAELGSGYAISIAGWAAQYPRAVFHSFDYNKKQAAWTLELAQKSGLENLHVHGLSIGEALEQELPEFDFIIAHGLYSWVDDEVRQEIRAFIKKFLKPGGCVCLGYNAMPGFKDIEPMRHVILQKAKEYAADDPVMGLRAGIKLLDALNKNAAAFFTNSPLAGSRLRQWQQDNLAYLTAELLAGSHKAYYFSELVAEMEGLHWAGRANMIDHLAAQNIPAALSELLAEETPIVAESLRDLYFNTAFRMDLFVDSRETSPSHTFPPELLRTSFTLDRVRKPLPESASRLGFHADLRAPLYTMLQSALAPGSLTLAQLEHILEIPASDILQPLCTLIALDWVHPGSQTWDPAQAKRLALFNATLSDMWDKKTINPLLSVTGGWIGPEDQLEHLAIEAILRKKPVEEYLMQILYADEEEPSLTEREEFKQSVRLYVLKAQRQLSLFLRRHGLG